MCDERDGAEVLHRIVGKVLKKVRVDGVRGHSTHTERHAVTGLLSEVAYAAVAARTGTVVDDDVTQRLLHGFGNGARRNVKRTSGGIGNHNADRVGAGAGLRQGHRGPGKNGCREGCAENGATVVVYHFIFLSCVLHRHPRSGRD